MHLAKTLNPMIGAHTREKRKYYVYVKMKSIGYKVKMEAETRACHFIFKTIATVWG